MKADHFAFAALVIFALVVVPLGLYVTGYFYLGKRIDYPGGPIERTYSRDWHATVFEPAGKLEAWVRSRPVQVLDEAWHEPVTVEQ